MPKADQPLAEKSKKIGIDYKMIIKYLHYVNVRFV